MQINDALRNNTLYKLFGNEYKTEIINLFIQFPNESFNLTDIERRTNMTRQTAGKNIDSIQKIGLVKKSGRDYKLNKEHKLSIFLYIIHSYNPDNYWNDLISDTDGHKP